MRRLAALGLLGLVVLGCSLTTRADDYFDPTGRTRLLTAFPDGAPAKITVSPDGLFVSVVSRVYAVPKAGGDPALVVSTTAAPRAVSTGRRGTVLVCSPAEGAQLFASTAPYAKQPLALPAGMAGCLTASISEDRLLVVPEQQLAEGASTPVVFALAEGSAPPNAVTVKVATSAEDADPISAAIPGTVLVGLHGYIDRANNSFDVCLIAKVESTAYYPPKIVAAGASGTFIVRGGRDDIRMVSKGSACCNKQLNPCNYTDVIPNIGEVRDFDATEKFLYWLGEGDVHRRPMDLVPKGDNTRDQVWPIANGTALAVEPDDSVAYVAQGTNLVRVELR